FGHEDHVNPHTYKYRRAPTAVTQTFEASAAEIVQDGYSNSQRDIRVIRASKKGRLFKEAGNEKPRNIGAMRKLDVKITNAVNVSLARKTFGGLYALSNLDQTIPYVIEIVFAFKGEGKGRSFALMETIKESLAEALVEFYPFAGRLVAGSDGKMAVRCTGEGVPFVEATSENDIGVLGDISAIDPAIMRKLVKHSDGAPTILEVPMLTVQVTTFKCGGIVVGIVINHVLVDGKALTDFIACWSDLARAKPPSALPLSRSIGLAPEETPAHRSPPTTTHNGSSIVPTTFEVISALVWISRTKALRIGPHETMKLLTAVDGRPKFDPPLPSGYFGNGIAWSCAECSAGELTHKPFSFAVQKVHEALQSVTENYIRSAIDHVELNRVLVDCGGNACCISKWSQLPFYNMDFGFGRPFQVAPATVPNDVIFVASHSRGSDDLVVSLGLPRDAMDIFAKLIQPELTLKSKL
ncbi:hypothetical protein NL676_039345, partial [Syzygium grande]